MFSARKRVAHARLAHDGVDHFTRREVVGERAKFVQHEREPLGPTEGLAREAGLFGVVRRLGEGESVLRGVDTEFGLRRGADAALGFVDDASRRRLVARIDDQSRVGEGALDLLAVIEAHARDHAVRDARAQHLLFEDPALRVGPVEDRHLIPRQRGLVGQSTQFGRDPATLVVLVARSIETDLLALHVVGEEVLRVTTGVLRDDRVGGVEDRLGRAEVLLEQDDLARRGSAVRTAGCCARRPRGSGRSTGRSRPPRRGCGASRRGSSPVGSARRWCPGTRRPAGT